MNEQTEKGTNSGSSPVRFGSGVTKKSTNNKTAPINNNTAGPEGKADVEALIRVPEMSKRLGFSQRKVREYASEGRIPSIKLNNRDIRFHWPTVIKKLTNATLDDSRL
jgi:predicted DNA-binding transcriptional regulator AlpA